MCYCDVVVGGVVYQREMRKTTGKDVVAYVVVVVVVANGRRRRRKTRDATKRIRKKRIVYQVLPLRVFPSRIGRKSANRIDAESRPF